jgi:hypothetical protein
MDIARVTITLLDVHPPVRRVVEVPLAITLGDLHLIIQAAMGWHNSHLYEFHDGRTIYSVPMPGWSDADYRPLPADKTALTDVLRAAKQRIGYVYDMGDDWQHRLDIARAGQAEDGIAYPRLVQAHGRCPPEDCGGFPGFENFLQAINDPSHPEHAELRDWYGGAFDPKDADQPAIVKNLAKIAARLARKKPARTAKPRKAQPDQVKAV